MTAIWIRMATATLGALALGACTLPHAEYSPDANAAPRQATEQQRPQYPVDAPPQTVQHSADPHDPVAQPSTGVSSAPLPPPSSSGPVSLNGASFIYASTPWRLVTTPAAYRRHRAAPARVTRLTRSEKIKLLREEREVRVAHLRHHGPLTRAERRAEVREAHATRTHVTPSAVRSHKGDRVNEVAARYGVSVEALMRANHFHHPNGVIPPGTKVIIPAEAATTERAAAPRGERTVVKQTTKVYRALRGDTIYAIGRKFKVSPREIEALNGFPPTTRLKTGQIVKLPGPPVVEHVAVAEPPRERPRATYTPPPSTPPPPSAPLTTNGPVPYTSLSGPRIPPSAPQARTYIAPVQQQQPQTPLGPPDAQVLLAGRGRFIWPVHGPVLTAFGPKPGGQRSDGLDIGATDGTPVRAAATGDVVYAGALPELGNLVLVKHEDGWITAYAHLQRAEVKIKDHVTQGQEVGQAGRSGAAAQSEVYFEIRYAPTPRDKARPVDPALLLSAQ